MFFLLFEMESTPGVDVVLGFKLSIAPPLLEADEGTSGGFFSIVLCMEGWKNLQDIRVVLWIVGFVVSLT